MQAAPQASPPPPPVGKIPSSVTPAALALQMPVTSTEQQQPKRQRGCRGCCAAAGAAIASLDWSALLLIVVLCIGTAALQGVAPVQRPLVVGDAAVVYPRAKGMPFVVALLVPAALSFFCAILPLELLAARALGAPWARPAAARIADACLSGWAALMTTGFLTELLKRLCGRLRPDFLARCQPALALDGALLGAAALDCTGPAKLVADGRMSFPSGHSSCAMAIGLFGALYICWALGARRNGALGRALYAPTARCGSGIAGRARAAGRALLREAAGLAVLLLVLLLLAWPWGVAASRFIDNRHNVSDIVAGLLLAITFVPPFVARLAARDAAAEAGVSVQMDCGHVLPVSNAAPATI